MEGYAAPNGEVQQDQQQASYSLDTSAQPYDQQYRGWGLSVMAPSDVQTETYNGVDSAAGAASTHGQEANGGYSSTYTPALPQARGGDDRGGANLLGGPDRTNLIVNYLPNEVTDQTLKDLFVDFGEIESARVIKEKGTHRSLGYGFVKFLNVEDAQKAVLVRNGHQVGDKRIKVSVARPQSDDLRNCKLYIANLPQHYEKAEVVSMFSPFGRILECRLLTDPHTGKSRNIAFVQYDSRAEATAALSMNGTMLEGSTKPLTVKHAEDQKERQQRLSQQGKPGTTTTDGGYGPIRGRQDAQSYRYDPYGPPPSAGFVPPAAPTSHVDLSGLLSITPTLQALASAPIPGLNQSLLTGLLTHLAQVTAVASPGTNPLIGAINGQPLIPQHHQHPPPPNPYASSQPGGVYNPYGAPASHAYAAPVPKPEPYTGPPMTVPDSAREPEGIILYVGNLPPTADAAFLEHLATQHARIVSCKVITQRGTSICKGFGFITAGDDLSASALVKGLNNMPMGEKSLRVMFRSNKPT